jgi:hypothetical protein
VGLSYLRLENQTRYVRGRCLDPERRARTARKAPCPIIPRIAAAIAVSVGRHVAEPQGAPRRRQCPELVIDPAVKVVGGEVDRPQSVRVNRDDRGVGRVPDRLPETRHQSGNWRERQQAVWPGPSCAGRVRACGRAAGSAWRYSGRSASLPCPGQSAGSKAVTAAKRAHSCAQVIRRVGCSRTISKTSCSGSSEEQKEKV